MEDKKRISIEELEYFQHRIKLFAQEFLYELLEQDIKFTDRFNAAVSVAHHYLVTYGIDAPFRSFFDLWHEFKGQTLEELKEITERNYKFRKEHPDLFPFVIGITE